jgi:hypothetical protein
MIMRENHARKYNKSIHMSMHVVVANDCNLQRFNLTSRTNVIYVISTNSLPE